ASPHADGGGLRVEVLEVRVVGIGRVPDEAAHGAPVLVGQPPPDLAAGLQLEVNGDRPRAGRIGHVVPRGDGMARPAGPGTRSVVLAYAGYAVAALDVGAALDAIDIDKGPGYGLAGPLLRDRAGGDLARPQEQLEAGRVDQRRGDRGRLVVPRANANPRVLD